MKFIVATGTIATDQKCANIKGIGVLSAIMIKLLEYTYYLGFFIIMLKIKANSL